MLDCMSASMLLRKSCVRARKIARCISRARRGRYWLRGATAVGPISMDTSCG